MPLSRSYTLSDGRVNSSHKKHIGLLALLILTCIFIIILILCAFKRDSLVNESNNEGSVESLYKTTKHPKDNTIFKTTVKHLETTTVKNIVERTTESEEESDESVENVESYEDKDDKLTTRHIQPTTELDPTKVEDLSSSTKTKTTTTTTTTTIRNIEPKPTESEDDKLTTLDIHPTTELDQTTTTTTTVKNISQKTTESEDDKLTTLNVQPTTELDQMITTTVRNIGQKTTEGEDDKLTTLDVQPTTELHHRKDEEINSSSTTTTITTTVNNTTESEDDKLTTLDVHPTTELDHTKVEELGSSRTTTVSIIEKKTTERDGQNVEYEESDESYEDIDDKLTTLNVQPTTELDQTTTNTTTVRNIGQKTTESEDDKLTTLDVQPTTELDHRKDDEINSSSTTTTVNNIGHNTTESEDDKLTTLDVHPTTELDHTKVEELGLSRTTTVSIIEKKTTERDEKNVEYEESDESYEDIDDKLTTLNIQPTTELDQTITNTTTVRNIGEKTAEREDDKLTTLDVQPTTEIDHTKVKESGLSRTTTVSIIEKKTTESEEVKLTIVNEEPTTELGTFRTTTARNIEEKTTESDEENVESKEIIESHEDNEDKLTTRNIPLTTELDHTEINDLNTLTTTIATTLLDSKTASAEIIQTTTDFSTKIQENTTDRLEEENDFTSEITTKAVTSFEKTESTIVNRITVIDETEFSESQKDTTSNEILTQTTENMVTEVDDFESTTLHETESAEDATSKKIVTQTTEYMITILDETLTTTVDDNEFTEDTTSKKIVKQITENLITELDETQSTTASVDDIASKNSVTQRAENMVTEVYDFESTTVHETQSAEDATSKKIVTQTTENMITILDETLTTTVDDNEFTEDTTSKKIVTQITENLITELDETQSTTENLTTVLDETIEDTTNKKIVTQITENVITVLDEIIPTQTTENMLTEIDNLKSTVEDDNEFLEDETSKKIVIQTTENVITELDDFDSTIIEDNDSTEDTTSKNLITSKTENIVTLIADAESTTEMPYEVTDNSISKKTATQKAENMLTEMDETESTSHDDSKSTEVTTNSVTQKNKITVTELDKNDATTIDENESVNDKTSKKAVTQMLDTIYVTDVIEKESTTVVDNIFTEETISEHFVTRMLLKNNRMRNNDDDVEENSTTLMQTSTEPIIPECPKPTPVCDTIYCKQSASKMLSLIDHSINPCDDFYKYSCGGKQINQIGEQSDDDIYKIDFSKNFREKYMKNFKKYHKSCLNYETDKSKASFHLKTLSIDTSGSDKFTNLTELISDIILFQPSESSTILKPLFDVVVDIGPEGTFIPVITLPLLSSSLIDADDGDIYRKDCKKQAIKYGETVESSFQINNVYLNCLSNLNYYKKNLKKSLISLKLFDNSKFNDTQEIDRIISFIETDVKNHMGVLTEFQRTDTIKNKNENPIYCTIDDLDEKYPQINWTRLFTKIFSDENLNISIVQVMFPNNLAKIFKFYEDYDFSQIKTTLLAMMAHDIYVDFIKPITTDRDIYCTKVVNKLMPDVAAKIYLDKFNQNHITYIENIAKFMFKKITGTMMTSINESTWITDMEKDEAIIELLSVKLVIDRGTIFNNKTLLNSKTDVFLQEDAFITNTIELKKKRRNLHYKILGKSADDLEYIWTLMKSPMDTSPLTINSLRSIILPFRLLTRLIHDATKTLNQYEYFSNLGYLIASEIAHFFSPQNVKKLELKDNMNYQSFVEHQLSDPEIAKYLNPIALYFPKNDIALTRDTRFTDDSGLRIAYETYEHVRESYHSDLPFLWMGMDISKLFYINFAQQFCTNDDSRGSLSIELTESEYLPNYFRLNSIIMNDVNFYEIFNCSVGSSMNPQTKTNQFPFLSHLKVDDVNYDLADNSH